MSKKALIIIIVILSVLLFGIVIFGVLKNTNAFSAPEGIFKKEYLIYEKRNAIADFDKYSKYVLGRSTELELSFNTYTSLYISLIYSSYGISLKASIILPSSVWTNTVHFDGYSTNINSILTKYSAL